ncbi:MAG: cellulose biosynthesis cyclic di-GMP-binding regulatory protein BcsB [Pseudomonadota bacterium]|nr:cellulose biosynthesis cyclic di-GMP-binding regulatory protein BcsB [Pseudomonadota bacterium]
MPLDRAPAPLLVSLLPTLLLGLGGRAAAAPGEDPPPAGMSPGAPGLSLGEALREGPGEGLDAALRTIPEAPIEPDQAERAKARRPGRHPADSAERHFDVGFEDALAIRSDLLLEGVDAEARVDFTVPEEWDLLEDPQIVLFFAHSAALLPDRSHFTATLNGQAIGSVRLDASNGREGRLEVRVPRELLAPYNHLRLRAVQHYGATCEDPFDPGLWTRVSKDSRVSMRYRRRPFEPELARFPYPLFDPTGYGPAELSLVLPAEPSATTIEAIGRLGVTLGRIADYRGVELVGTVETVREADSHALLVGIWSESHEIRALLGEGAPRPSEGLVAMVPNPADPTRAVLVVTGADAEGLRHATLAVASQNRHELLSGAQARVDYVTDGRAPEHRRVPRAVPAEPSFALSALGMTDQTVRGFYTPTVRVPLELDGDAAIRPGGATAEVHYAYAAGLDPRLSSLEVRLDGITVKSVSLDDTDGSSGSTVEVRLPDGVMTPRSALEVAFTLFPEDFDACGFVSGKSLWATVYADTTIEIARDNVAHLPDLGRLRYGGWPFTLDPADGAVVAALPDRPTAADVGAGFLLGAALGRSSNTVTPAFRLAAATGLDFVSAPDTNFILLASGAPHQLHDQLVQSGMLTLSGGTARTLMEDGERAISATMSGTEARVEETLHPTNPTRAALVLEATEGTDLVDLVGAISDPARVAKLDGNLALIAQDGAVRTLQVAERRQVGTYPVGVTLVLAARRYWILLGVAIVAGTALFATVKRAWVRAREA